MKTFQDHGLTTSDDHPTHADTHAHAPLLLPPPDHPVDGAAPPARRSHLLLWLILTLLAVAMLAVAWWLLRPGAPADHAGAAAQSVGAAKVVSGDMDIVLTGLGTVTPLATITVQTQISGQLLSVDYREGQLVEKGDLLAQIDPRPYQISLQQARGALAHDMAVLAQAKSDLGRYTTLNRQDSIARQQVSDQQFMVDQDQGLVTEDQASIASAELNLTYCRITAPVSGRVGLRLVDPGNYVQTSGSTGLVVITQLQPISVIFVLPEDNIPAVGQQLRAKQTLQVAAYDRTNATRIASGRLLAVDNTVDTTTGTVKLRASFPNDDLSLFPNQFINARMLLQTLHQITEAPTAAIQNGAPGTFVYLLKPDGTVAVQAVTIGTTDGDRTQILSGLKPGDSVVVDGADNLKAGAKVRVTSDPADPAASQGAAPGPGAPPGQQPGNATPVPGKARHHRQAGQPTP